MDKATQAKLRKALKDAKLDDVLLDQFVNTLKIGCSESCRQGCSKCCETGSANRVSD